MCVYLSKTELHYLLCDIVCVCVCVCVCGIAVDRSAGGDAGTAAHSTASESEEPGLRSWPPKSHTSGAAVPGITSFQLVSRLCGFLVATKCL